MGRRSRGTSKSLASPATVRLRALLSLGMVVGLGAVGTLATWSDEATATATFSAGTIDLTLNDEADDAVGLTSLTVKNMYPGSRKAASVKVANNGTLGFDYTMTGAAADGIDGPVGSTSLSAALRVAVYEGAVASDGLSCETSGKLLAQTSDTRPSLFDGSSITTLRLHPELSGSPSLQNLCIQIELPDSAVDTVQGTTTAITFTFVARQITASV